MSLLVGCCGQGREALRRSRRTATENGASTPSAPGGPPITLESRAEETLYARGVSGTTYVFTPGRSAQPVASEDAGPLVASGYFRVVS